MSIDDIVTEIVRREAAEAGQWTLGKFIDALQAAPQRHHIRFRFASACVGDFDSYRGYYDHLAIEPTGRSGSSTVAEVLAKAAYCMGRKFTGYKGGDFLMTEDTPLWVAYYGQSGGSRVVGLTVNQYDVIIETAEQDD